MTRSFLRACTRRIRGALHFFLIPTLCACGGGALNDDTSEDQLGGGFADVEIYASASAAEVQSDAAGGERRRLAAAPLALGDASMLPARAFGWATERVAATPDAYAPSSIGAFRINCGFSHMANDDPIVFPGQPGRSHLHTFFGNTGTDAHSTAESISGSGNSTCNGGIVNRSAYWVPSMIDTRSGAPVVPTGALIYYKTGYNGLMPHQVNPLPQGLRMIAGDSRNTMLKGPYVFKCIGPGVNTQEFKTIPNCPVGSTLWAMVTFPQCVALDAQGKPLLDSPDHKSHLSYTVTRTVGTNGVDQRYGRWCPETHPYPIVEVSIVAGYAVREADAAMSWRLSSDSPSAPAGTSSHADLLEGWNRPLHGKMVDECLRASKDCHAHLLGAGLKIY